MVMKILFLIKWGRPELFHNDQGHGFTRVTRASRTAALDQCEHRASGSITTAMGCWIFLSAAIIPKTLTCGISRPRASCPTVSNMPRMAGESICFTISVTANLKRSARRLASTAGAGRWRPPRRICAARAIPICLSRMITACRNFTSTTARRFHEVGEQTGVGFAPKSGMNAAFGDILNQGRYAVYVSNISEDGILIQGNNLWVPKEGTAGDAIKYQNLARDFGVELGGWSFGAQFGDLNNDGTLDLYLTNGYISLDRNRSYWYDFSKVAGGNSTIIGDAKNWPAFEGRSLSGYQTKRVWLNDGAGKFIDVAQAVGVTDTYDGRAVALADLWNRGVLDVVVANQKGPLLIYKNTVTPENEWIEFALEGNGQQPQRDWRAGDAVLEWPAAGAGSFRRQRFRRAERPAAAFRLGQEPADRKSRDSLAVGQSADHRQSRGRIRLHKIKEPA